MEKIEKIMESVFWYLRTFTAVSSIHLSIYLITNYLFISDVQRFVSVHSGLHDFKENDALYFCHNLL